MNDRNFRTRCARSTRGALLLAAGIGLAALAEAAETPEDYSGAVTLTTQRGEALHRVEVPVTVYAGVQHADLRDVRVFNAAQEPVPFSLVDNGPSAAVAGAVFSPPIFPIWSEPGKAAGQLHVQVEQRADGSVVSIKSSGTGAVPAQGRQVSAYLVDASKLDAQLSSLVPQWKEAPANYIGTAHVEASDDLRLWRTLTNGAPLAYLSQGGARLIQETIEFAPAKARYYRIGFTPGAPELTGVAAAAPSPGVERQRQSLRIAGRPGTKPGEVEYDTGVRAPIDRVRLLVAEPNALAPVRIEARPDVRAEWRRVATTVGYRILRDGYELTSPAITVVPDASQQWRIVVDQAGGGLGATLPELEISWPSRNLVFLARGDGPFMLAFGKRDAAPAALALATLVPGYREGNERAFPAASVSTIKLRPLPPPSLLSRVIGDVEPRKAGLWAALLAGVLVLALMAWRLAHQMRQGAAAPPPSEKSAGT